MKRPLRAILGLLAAAALSALIGFLLAESRLYDRIRPIEAFPGVAWKDLVSYGLPFVLLAWVFVVRAGATSSLLGAMAAAVFLVGHAWSTLDWTVFLVRGSDLARGGVPAPAFALALVVPFLLAALWQVGRRPLELRDAYVAKDADAADVKAVRKAALVHGSLVVAVALVAAALVVGAILAAGTRAAAFPVPASTALGLALAAVGIVGLVLALVPRALARRARPDPPPQPRP